jgi:hypothetical protein
MTDNEWMALAILLAFAGGVVFVLLYLGHLYGYF